MLLWLNTLDQQQTTIGLVSDGRLVVSRRLAARSEQLAAHIQRLVGKRAIDGIIVAAGPSGFTASRSGVVLANALGYAWQVPVTVVSSTPDWSIVRFPKRFMPIMPVYDRQPSITLQ